MTDKKEIQKEQIEEVQGEFNEEEYGWAFHKKPLLFAAIATGLLYAFVFFYINR